MYSNNFEKVHLQSRSFPFIYQLGCPVGISDATWFKKSCKRPSRLPLPSQPSPPNQLLPLRFLPQETAHYQPAVRQKLKSRGSCEQSLEQMCSPAPTRPAPPHPRPLWPSDVSHGPPPPPKGLQRFRLVAPLLSPPPNILHPTL